MRGTLLTTVAALALATPAMAADLGYVPPIEDPVYSPAPMAVVGHLQLGVGIADSDFSDSVGVFTGWGRVNIPFSAGWNLQLDVGGGALFEDGESYSHIGTYAHLWGNVGGARLGVFGGIDFPTGAEIGTIGLEGEFDVGNVTLGAQGSYNSVIDTSFDFWGLRGWADWYFNPNTKVGGELAWWEGDGDDLWGASLDIEHRFSGTPVSAFAEVAYIDADGDDAWSAMIGARVFMDGGLTLQEHDRQVPFDVRGPGFSGIGF